MATTESSDTTMADFLGPRPALYTSRDLVQDSLRLLQENGGYGDIYCALMRVPGGDVKIALKRLRFGSEDDGRKVSLGFGWCGGSADFPIMKVKGDLLDEAVVWFHLRHPNILPFYGFYLNRGDTFLISPFLENGSLLKYLNQNCKADRIKFVSQSLLLLFNRVFRPSPSAQILEIASGLVYLHKEGVIHGDVKAANVLVSLTGSTRLCDFGLSKFIDTAPGRSRESTVGSLNWISPERLVPSCPADMARTKQSDVYAFALTGYEVHGLGPGQFFPIDIWSRVDFERPDAVPRAWRRYRLAHQGRLPAMSATPSNTDTRPRRNIIRSLVGHARIMLGSGPAKATRHVDRLPRHIYRLP